MVTSSRPRRLSVAATSAALLLIAAVVTSAVLVRETESQPAAPAATPVEPDRRQTVRPRPVATEQPVRDRSAGPAPRETDRQDRQGPGLVILAGVTAGDQPLADATVFVFGQMDRQARTDEAGRCELWLDLSEKRSAYAIKIEKSGFVSRSVILRDEIHGHDEWPLEVELEAIGATAPVSGYLFSEAGPVAGETVLLYTTATHMRYHATSNDEGFFDLGEVGVGSYQLRVRPQGRYEDYVDSAVDVAAPGLDLDLELVPVRETGSLRGHMVTPDGAVASDFTLLLRSRQSLGKVVEVHADRSGWFALEGLAEGEILLESRGFPRQIVRGLKANAADAADAVKVVVDTGVAALDGLVEDENRQPVAGARVQLLWTQREGDVEFSSARQSTTDAAGRFRFEGFAAVEHEIRVQQPGYSPALQTIPAGQMHAAVRLSPAGSSRGD